MPTPVLTPFTDLASAAQATMLCLQQHLGLGQWMFTRVEGDAWVILDTLGTEYPVEPGAVLAWSDSLCSRMVAGDGPMLAPHVMDVPAYAAAPIARELDIESYVGMPIFRHNGSLFGTMCAIDKHPSPNIEQYRPLVELMSRMLGFAVDRQAEADVAARRAELSENDALVDQLTGIFNRRGWDRLLSREDLRRLQNGSPACAFVVDLDGFKEINDTLGHSVGDTHLKNVAACLKASFRANDIVARTGGDEFSILAVECDGTHGAQLLARVNAALAAASLSASVGFKYQPAERLFDVWKAADQEMYATKRDRRTKRLRQAIA